MELTTFPSMSENASELFNETGNGTTSGDTSGGPISLNFLDSFVKALSVMLVSELGDKTFFLAAILAMRYNKLTVFLGAISSLILMTVVSALLGYGVTSLIPKIYTFYASIVIMFIFGLKMFWDAWRMKPNEAQELQHEAETEINRREGRASESNPNEIELAEGGAGQMAEPEVETRKSFAARILSYVSFRKSNQQFTPTPTEEPRVEQGNEQQEPLNPSQPPTLQSDVIELETGKSLNSTSDPPQPESSRFGKQCVKIFKVFVNAFGLIFLAEWGDRSQLATIVLASVNDVAGIILGGIVGHTLCTGLAVVVGVLIAKKISVRAVTVIGGIVFIGFAIATLVMGPEAESEVSAEDL